MAKPSITRNEAMERLAEYLVMSEWDAESAHMLADSVLLEIIEDKEITDLFRAINRGYKFHKHESTPGGV